MAVTKESLTTQSLSLPEELILMLLNEENGYFHQVPGWDLNCAVAGAVLAELSLLSRIDTDMESLFLVDQTETGNPVLDPTLQEIASEPVQRNTQYWIERLAPRAESVIDLTLDHLVDLKILEHHDGEFWTLAPIKWHTDIYGNSLEDTADEFIKTRITKVLFFEAIPDPRDIIVICLVNTCDVFRFMFQLDDEAEERIKSICQMDLIGRSIAEAGRTQPSRPVASTFPPNQANSGCPAASVAAQSPCARWQRSRALCRAYTKVWPRVRDPSSICQTHDLHRRATDKSLGASARADVPES